MGGCMILSFYHVFLGCAEFCTDSESFVSLNRKITLYRDENEKLLLSYNFFINYENFIFSKSIVKDRDCDCPLALFQACN